LRPSDSTVFLCYVLCVFAASAVLEFATSPLTVSTCTSGISGKERHFEGQAASALGSPYACLALGFALIVPLAATRKSDWGNTLGANSKGHRLLMLLLAIPFGLELSVIDIERWLFNKRMFISL